MGAVLDHWGPHCITTEPPPAFDSRGRAVVARVGLGTDHGAGAGRQCSHLVYVCMLDGTPHVWIWDEAWDEDRTADWEDARAILDMLERNGVLLPEVDEVIGDRPHGGDRYGNAKSNLQLQAEVARLLGVRVDQLPRAFRDWRTAEKWEGSSLHGFRLLNKLARRGHLHVHPRCERFIQGAKYWSGKPKDPLKDALDSARYPVEVMVDGAVLFDSYQYARQAR